MESVQCSALVEGARYVLETAMQLPVEPCFGPACGVGATDIQAHAEFRGARSGRLTIRMAPAAAHRIASLFRGRDTAAGSEECADALTELAGMICGRVLRPAGTGTPGIAGGDACAICQTEYGAVHLRLRTPSQNDSFASHRTGDEP